MQVLRLSGLKSSLPTNLILVIRPNMILYRFRQHRNEIIVIAIASLKVRNDICVSNLKLDHSGVTGIDITSECDAHSLSQCQIFSDY
jgi:hypothetical protein